MTWLSLILWLEVINMGTETAALIALGVTGVGSIYGASQARKGAKHAKREARAFEEQLGETRTRVAKEQDTLSKKIEQQQRKVAAGQARANRSRLRGGVFGESEPTQRTLNPTLG